MQLEKIFFLDLCINLQPIEWSSLVSDTMNYIFIEFCETSRKTTVVCGFIIFEGAAAFAKHI